MSYTRLLTVLVLCGAVSVLVGCGSSDEVTAKKLRKKLTPELYSTAETREQFKNTMTIAVDHTTRQASHDLRWLLLLEHPLHLTEYPIP